MACFECMDKGHVIACGTHDELIKLVGEQDRLELQVNTEPDRVIAIWQTVNGVRSVSRTDGTITLLADDSNVVLPRLFDAGFVCSDPSDRGIRQLL